MRIISLSTLLTVSIAVAMPMDVVASAWEELSADECVITVNGLQIQKKDVESYIALMEALYRNRYPKASEDTWGEIKRRIKASAKDVMIQRRLLYSNLCTNYAIAATRELRDEHEDRLRKTFCRGSQTLDQLKDVLAKSGHDNDFAYYCDEDLAIQNGLYLAYPGRSQVTEEDVTNAISYVENYNKIAEATNKLVKARINAVLARISQGEDFSKLADEFSEDEEKEPGGDLGICDQDMFAGEGAMYIQMLSDLEEGDTTGMLKTSTGYEIIKKLPDASIRAQDKKNEWHLARIFFRCPYFFPEQTEEELIEDLRKEKYQDLMNEIVPQFFEKAIIEYPQGDVFDSFSTSKQNE